MEAYENTVIGKSAVPSLTAAVLLMAVIPFLFFLPWRKKHKGQTKIRYLLAGAAGFLVSARVLELGLHMFCIVLDNPVSRFINGNTAAYVLYGVTAAGVFEECGRHIILKYILKKDRTPENAVLYGIGHGGIEILAVILPAIALYLAIAVLFSSGPVENALSTLNITPETAAAALPSVQAAASFSCGTAAMNVLERLIAMFVHIGLTVIVYYGITLKKKALLPLAILLHMLVDTFAALYQKNAVPLWAVETWAAVWTGIIVFIAYRLYKAMKALPESQGASL